MSKVAVVVKTRAKAGKRDALHQLFLEHLASRALENPAQEVVCVVHDATDADVLYLFELYSSQADLEQNGQAPWFWEYLTAAAPLIEGQPEMGSGIAAWAKGVTL